MCLSKISALAASIDHEMPGQFAGPTVPEGRDAMISRPRAVRHRLTVFSFQGRLRFDSDGHSVFGMASWVTNRTDSGRMPRAAVTARRRRAIVLRPDRTRLSETSAKNASGILLQCHVKRS